MLKYLTLCFVALAGYYAWTIYPIKHGPGKIAPEKPDIEYVRNHPPIQYQNNVLKPVVKFEGKVRILSKKLYLFDNRKKISPVDLLIGWGDMSDERNIDFINFHLEDRYFRMDFVKPPITKEEMFAQMDLLHIIPSDEELLKKSRGLRSGNIVNIEGLFVDVESGDTYNWSTELYNNDNTRLENIVLWVTKLEVL